MILWYRDQFKTFWRQLFWDALKIHFDVYDLPLKKNNKESSLALIYYWKEWQGCKYIMDGSASSKGFWKVNPHTGDSMNENIAVEDFTNVMVLNQIHWLFFEIASLMCCQLDYALKLSNGAWLVLPVKVAALRCVPCAVCCPGPVYNPPLGQLTLRN